MGVTVGGLALSSYPRLEGCLATFPRSCGVAPQSAQSSYRYYSPPVGLPYMNNLNIS